MGKRCIICKEEANYLIKNTNDFYCQECAEDNFGDISYLITVEEQAKQLKQMIEEKHREEEKEEDLVVE